MVARRLVAAEPEPAPVADASDVVYGVADLLDVVRVPPHDCQKRVHVRLRHKDNIVRFIVNSSPLLIYELNILRVSPPRSKVQQRVVIKEITKVGCGSVYNFKKFNRWQPLLVKRALVFGSKIPLLSRK